MIQESVIRRDSYCFQVLPGGGVLKVHAYEVNAGMGETHELIDPHCAIDPDRLNEMVRITFETDPDRVAFTLPFAAARQLGAILIAETCIASQ